MQSPPPNLKPLVLIIVLLVIAAGAAGFLLFRPRLAFTNTLAAPVNVAVGGAAPVSVPAGGTVRLPLPFGKTVVAEWELVRPISADSAPMERRIPALRGEAPRIDGPLRLRIDQRDVRVRAGAQCPL
jgi:hypothetical protein